MANSLPNGVGDEFYEDVPTAGGGGGTGCSSVVPGISGLTRYWTLDEGSGTSAADSSGNSATMTIIGGPTWVAGKIGAHALQFTARSQYATNLNSIANLTDFTFAAWVKPDDLAGSGGHNIVFSGVLQNMWLEILPNGHPNFHYYDNNDYTDTSTTIATGAWRHVAVTVDGADGTTGTLKIYVDGSLTLTATPTITQRTDCFAISTYGPGVGNYGFIGTIDELPVFNRALNSTEVNSIATCN
jgi:hypothetical protein